MSINRLEVPERKLVQHRVHPFVVCARTRLLLLVEAAWEVVAILATTGLLRLARRSVPFSGTLGGLPLHVDRWLVTHAVVALVVLARWLQ